MKSFLAIIIIWTIGSILSKQFVPLSYHLLAGYIIGLFTMVLIYTMEEKK